MPRQIATRADGASCPGVTLDFLLFRPTTEFQARDVYRHLNGDWPVKTVTTALERLVARGRVTKVREGRHVWYRVAPSTVARFWGKRRPLRLVADGPTRLLSPS